MGGAIGGQFGPIAMAARQKFGERKREREQSKVKINYPDGQVPSGRNDFYATPEQNMDMKKRFPYAQYFLNRGGAFGGYGKNLLGQ